MLVKLDTDLSVIFGTQLFLRKHFLDPLTNAGLEKAVRARAAAQPGVKVSNTGGWQSEPNLFDWREPEVGKLAAELDRAIQQFVSFGQAAPVRLQIRRAVGLDQKSRQSLRVVGREFQLHDYLRHDFVQGIEGVSGVVDIGGQLVDTGLVYRNPKPFLRAAAFTICFRNTA